MIPRRPTIKPHLLLTLALAAALKTGLVMANVIPFNADEAVVALMARHILQGERPVFFYGQAYLGSLDAWDGGSDPLRGLGLWEGSGDELI